MSGKKSRVPEGHHASEWSVIMVGGSGIDTMLTVLCEDWGPSWIASLEDGKKDCTCCSRPMGYPKAGVEQAAIVAASMLPVGKKGRPAWIVVTMCLSCANKHPSLHSAGEALCQQALVLLGSTETSVLGYLPVEGSTLQ